MIIHEQSLPTCKDYATTYPIHLFLQFYIDNDKNHYREIKYALKKNVKNPHIESIILLNERIYTEDELGITSPKIKQIVIQKRITYYDFLNYKIDGYKVLINSDIFVDKTIQNIRSSDIHLHKKMFALLRYEYNNGEPELFCRPNLTTGRDDSQDTWIIHSNHSFTKKELNIFKIPLGIPGCDNKITYLFKILGYDIYNDPSYIKTYHCHENKHQILVIIIILKNLFMLVLIIYYIFIVINIFLQIGRRTLSGNDSFCGGNSHNNDCAWPLQYQNSLYRAKLEIDSPEID